ncbi:unnamed protein product, partial [Didymodactylos carnosus]
HNDLSWLIRANFRNQIGNIDLNNMTQYTLKNTTISHTDITRLRQGKIGGQFWSIYTDCNHQGLDAIIGFLEQIDLMNRIISKYNTVFEFASTANDIRTAFSNKKIA